MESGSGAGGDNAEIRLGTSGTILATSTARTSSEIYYNGQNDVGCPIK
jgi:hypothetical protein